MTTQNDAIDSASWDAELNRDDLSGENITTDPLALFGEWFEQARAADFVDATAAAIATADRDARPSVRTVLVKSFDEKGFYFYTNYSSRKGQELAVNPHAALLFWWDKLERQVRIEGPISELAGADSDAYFARRPRGSQIGAQASPQSQIIASRGALEQRVADAEAEFGDAAIPRPNDWGGYCLTPKHIEFWQGRSNRLHDRLRYTRTKDGWRTERLAP